MGVLTCLTGLSRQRNWYDSSKLLDERQIKESGGRWQSLLPLPAFSARENEGGSASRVLFSGSSFSVQPPGVVTTKKKHKAG